jgi:hypothetical protein
MQTATRGPGATSAIAASSRAKRRGRPGPVAEFLLDGQGGLVALFGGVVS